MRVLDKLCLRLRSLTRRASARGSDLSTRHSASVRADPGLVAEAGWLVSLVSGMGSPARKTRRL